MDTTDQLQALRKRWWVVVTALAIFVAGAVLATARAVPQYASTVTFFVSASIESGSALQADQFTLSRITSYTGVLSSERMARAVIEATGVELTPDQVAAEISVTTNSDSLLMTAKVVDSDPERAQEIAQAVAEEFGPLIAELETGAVSVSLNVISGPTISAGPVSPSWTLNLGLGTLAGLTVGTAIALLLESLKRTVRDTESIGRVTGLPVLAAIPSGPQRATTLAGEDAPGDTRAEAFRRLRTNLAFSPVAQDPHVYLVTSAVDGEGKSTTAANLASTFASSGRTTLLLEANLRDPSLAHKLELLGTAGLTDVLVRGRSFDEAVQTAAHGAMDVLVAGDLPSNPSELLGSTTMSDLLTTLRERYDAIVIDTPSLLPYADAAVATRWADVAVLVVRHDKTTEEQLERAADELHAASAAVPGTVLNAVPRWAHRYLMAKRSRRYEARTVPLTPEDSGTDSDLPGPYVPGSREAPMPARRASNAPAHSGSAPRREWAWMPVEEEPGSPLLRTPSLGKPAERRGDRPGPRASASAPKHDGRPEPGASRERPDTRPTTW